MEETNYSFPQHYKNYVGAYGKRFYQPFEAQYIFKILDYREREAESIRSNPIVIPEFLLEDALGLEHHDPNSIFSDPRGSWYDCEDTCIITNEIPILEINWVTNVNHPNYKSEYFNPFL